MSTLLIYKQRTLKPNHPQTPEKNAAHVTYIATRPGVMKNDMSQSGLFGALSDLQFQNNIELDKAVSRVKEISNQKKNVFRSMISFTDEQAAGLGLKNLSDWQEYAKKQISILAHENGIKLENLEWVAAVHDKAGHPHVHIAFWDRNQQVQVQFVPAKKISGIRRKLIDNTYPELKAEKIQRQELAKKDLHETFRSSTEDLTDSFLTAAIGSYRMEKLLSCNRELFAEFTDLRNSLREYKGSMMYKYLPTDLKRASKLFLRKLINSDEKLKMFFSRYIHARVDYNRLYSASKDISGITKREIEKTEKELVNKLLRAIRDMNYTLFELSGNGQGETQFTEKEVMTMSVNCLLGVFSDLSKTLRQPKNSSYTMPMGGDLSRAARIEKAKEAKDNGLGVER